MSFWRMSRKKEHERIDREREQKAQEARWAEERHEAAESLLTAKRNLIVGVVAVVVALTIGLALLIPGGSDESHATGSMNEYQKSVGEICDKLNVQNTEVLANLTSDEGDRLANSPTLAQQRNAVLDSWDAASLASETYLGEFRATAPPASLSIRFKVTVVAWHDLYLRFLHVATSVGSAANATGLLAAVRQIPSENAAIQEDLLTRTTGLEALGGSYCRIVPPSSPHSVTLPAPRGRLNPAVNPTAQGY